MRASIERMLDGAIDYAGLFPPAKQSMEVAVRDYLRFVDGPEAWIVSRFVCSASRLAEFEQVVSRLQPAPSIPMTVVGTGGPDLDAFESALEADAGAMTKFEEMLGDACPIEAFEIRTPSAEDLPTVIEDLGGFDEIDVFVEVPLGDAIPESLAQIAESEWLGAKARTGGLTPDAFPAPSALAAFLQSCLHLDVPFKLTAGLHHPLHHFDREIGTPMHGFLNAFAATALAMEHDLSKSDIERVLGEESGDALRFTPDAVEWGEYRVGLEGLDDMRALLVGFGSCSVTDPLKGLKKLGLMGAGAR